MFITLKSIFEILFWHNYYYFYYYFIIIIILKSKLGYELQVKT